MMMLNLKIIKAVKLLPPTSKDGEAYGLDSPRLRIRLWAEEQVVGDLSIGDAQEGMVYTKSSENEFVCLVDETIVERLMPARIFAQN